MPNLWGDITTQGGKAVDLIVAYGFTKTGLFALIGICAAIVLSIGIYQKISKGDN
jgi:hypothetical protein